METWNRKTGNRETIRLAVQGLWLQYKGIAAESIRTLQRVENAAWTRQPPRPADLPGPGGLLVAT